MERCIDLTSFLSSLFSFLSPSSSRYYGVWTLFYTGMFLTVVTAMLQRNYNLRNVLLCLGSTFGSFVVSIGTWHSCVQWVDGGAAARFLGGIFLFSLPAILWGAFATVNRKRNRRNLGRALKLALQDGRSDVKQFLYRRHGIDTMSDLVKGEPVWVDPILERQWYVDASIATAVGALFFLHLVVLNDISHPVVEEPPDIVNPELGFGGGGANTGGGGTQWAGRIPPG